MTGIFKANNPYNIFLLFIYGLLLKLPLFLFPKVPLVQPLDGVLYKYFLQALAPLGNNTPVIYAFISFVLLTSQALSFNKAVNAQRMHQKPNYLTGMSYLLITSLFSEWYLLSAPLIVNTFIIWAWSKLCTLHNTPNPKTTIFNIGFVIGLATFFYFPAIAFILLIMVGLSIAHPFQLREWLIALAGILTPAYFFASWLFLTGQLMSYRLPHIIVTLPTFKQGYWASAAISLLAISALMGSFFIYSNLRRQVVQTRKSWQLIYLYLLVALFAPFLNDTHRFNYWILAAVPVSIITASSFFYPEKKWFPLLIHWGMVAICISMSYFVK